MEKNPIFVGNKNETIRALVEIIKRKTLWTDYMEQVMDLITVNTYGDIDTQIITQREFSHIIT